MKPLVTTCTLMLLMLCTGCGDSHESLAAESVSAMKELIAAMDTVKDEASATSAKPRLKSIMERLNDINARQAKLPMMTEPQMKAIEAAHGKEMEELQEKMVGHMMRIMLDPKIAAVLQDLDSVMKKGKS